MKKTLTKNSADSLLQGLQTIISTNRYSLSVDDEVLLKECITALEEFKRLGNGNSKPNLELLIKVVDLITKFLTAGDAFKDLM